MPFNSLQIRFIVAWFGVVTLLVGISLASGIPTTVGYGLPLFALGFVAPVIVLAVVRGMPQRDAKQIAGHGRPGA